MRDLIQRAPKAAHGLALSTAFILAACGGDGGSTTTTPTPVDTSLTVSGTAATGAALAGASVTATCGTGTGTATTSSTGTYTITLSTGSLPCVLTATSADGNTTLHSVAAGSGSGTATSNITPLSELLVAQLAGTDPATFVANFSSSTTISTGAVATAQTAVLQTLTAAGVDTSQVSNIVSGTLTAGSGNGYDGVLDALKTTITDAGVGLSDLTKAIADASSTGAGTTGGSAMTTLLKPANSDCTALKSGVHRVIDLTEGGSTLFTIDAVALTATSGGTTYHLTKSATCRYTLDDPNSITVVVAQSGMAIWMQGSGTTASVGISLPEQKLDIASLAGVYNRVSYHGASSGDTGDFGTATFSATGANTTSTNCTGGYGSCVTDSNPGAHLVANTTDGGFDYVNDSTGVVEARVFAFHKDDKTVLVAQENDSLGTVTVLSPQASLPLPAVGTVTPFWQFNVVPSTGLSALADETQTVTAVDTGTGLVTRQQASDGRIDNITFNDPYPGMRYRQTNACTTSTGGPFNCSGTVQMRLQGSGITLSVSSVPTKHFVTVSINKP
jgi:hypothetical protein